MEKIRVKRPKMFVLHLKVLYKSVHISTNDHIKKKNKKTLFIPAAL